MQEIAVFFGEHGLTLRTGHAAGADQAFEKGADGMKGEIYLPWLAYESTIKIPKSFTKLSKPTLEALSSVKDYHPGYKYLKRGAKLLQARNSHIILGKDLKTPVNFMLCWTLRGSGTGGTGQAIRICSYHGIPFWDFGKKDDYDEFMEMINNWDEFKRTYPELFTDPLYVP